VAHFQGSQSTKEDLGIGFAVGTMPGKLVVGHLPSLQGPGWAGVAELLKVQLKG